MTRDTEHWTRVAADWIAWAREPGHDAFWAYRDSFAEFVGRGDCAALDIGCAEGRVSRLLGTLGYAVTAADPVDQMLEAARTAGSAQAYHLARATDLPFADGTFGLALLYNCLMDIEDAPATLAEARRVTGPGGRVVLSIVHPLADLLSEADAEGAITQDYFSSSVFDAVDEDNGLRMHFFGWARPFLFYTDALAQAGLTIARMAEPRASKDAAFQRQAKWQRLPLFLWIEARNPAQYYDIQIKPSR